MWRYMMKRLVLSVVTIWFIATATFFGMHAVPGDPLTSDKATNPKIRANLEAKYGLDKPLGTQYLLFLQNLSQGDLGISYTQENRRVNDIIREHFPVSATLGILAVVFAGLGGVLWGALTALYRNRLPDTIIMFLVILGISVPSFVIAAIGQLSLVNLNNLAGTSILPVGGWGTVQHMILGYGLRPLYHGLSDPSDALVYAGDRQFRLYSHRQRQGLTKYPGVQSPSIAQCGFTRGNGTRPRHRQHYYGRFRGGNRLCYSRFRSLLRSGSSTAGLHRHYGDHGFLWCFLSLHGHCRGFVLRLD